MATSEIIPNADDSRWSAAPVDSIMLHARLAVAARQEGVVLDEAEVESIFFTKNGEPRSALNDIQENVEKYAEENGLILPPLDEFTDEEYN